jgi:hypothetical protein
VTGRGGARGTWLARSEEEGGRTRVRVGWWNWSVFCLGKKMFFGVVLGRAQAHNSPDMVQVLWVVYYLVGLIVGN